MVIKESFIKEHWIIKSISIWEAMWISRGIAPKEKDMHGLKCGEIEIWEKFWLGSIEKNGEKSRWGEISAFIRNSFDFFAKFQAILFNMFYPIKNGVQFFV